MTKLTLIDIYHDDYHQDYLDGVIDNETPREEVSTWSADQIELFAEYYEGLIDIAENFIDSNKKVLDYITKDRYYNYHNVRIEDGSLEIDLTEARGCSCCSRETSRTSIPLSWLTGDSWKEYFAKIEAKEAEEERQKQLKREQQAEERRLAKEAKDKAEYERLKEKFKS